jgi:hypothetical protein
MKYVLFSLSAFVFYAIFYFAKVNGLDALGHKTIESGRLPGLDEPLRTFYTGVEPKAPDYSSTASDFPEHLARLGFW